MCGISGYISNKSMASIEIVNEMVKALHYRGPDDCGAKMYDFEDTCIAFGQSRLSIIDLSNGGHQPMEYKQFSIVFNGEIYNYLEIKKELELLGHTFKSASDTEVILHAFEEWRLKAVDKFIGMFAFSLLDKEKQNIYIYRDRAGVKPLYYYISDKLFLFSSELKSFHKHPMFKKQVDIAALKLFFDFGYIPAPYAIFKNCYKLKPGHYLTYNIESSEFTIHQYWNVKKYYSSPKLEISYKEAKEKLHTIFKSAFKYRMIADVPVGVFLSGGYDSTAVTAILQHEQTTRLKTFTIGFKEGNNEAPYARATAKYLGTDHNEFFFSTKEAQDIIPELPFFYDEPFYDSSALPTILVSKMAKKEVTVALSSDGGDEIFTGYTRYHDLQKRLNILNAIPANYKKICAKLMKKGAGLLPEKAINLVHRVETVSKSLDKDKFMQAQKLFYYTHTLPKLYQKKLFKTNESHYASGFEDSFLNFKNDIEIAMAIDYNVYLPDDILTKVDRATMSVSLEGRDPLLDHRIIEFAAQLPLCYKYDGKTQKKILKDIVHDYVPKEMMDRQKSGFSIPIYSWLKGDLSYLLDEYLSKEALIESNVFNVDFVLEKVMLFKKEKLHHITFIWKVLMFQMWHKKWM